jgi:hypothetical protein
MDAMERQQLARVRTIEMLEGNYERLGKPAWDIKSKSFWEFFDILVSTWRVGYPMELLEWLETRDMDLADEISLGKQVKKGMHKSYAFPMGLFKMIKAYWPMADLIDKEFGFKFKRKYPIFRNSNYT